LNESGAMTTIGGREDGMAYDFYRANLFVADFLSPISCEPALHSS